jgi:hypothetical protein
VKLATVPGGKLASVKMGVAPVRLFSTTTFVKVMLPVFRTVPL